MFRCCAAVEAGVCACPGANLSLERTPPLRLEPGNVGSSDGTMAEPTPEFDRDEVLICMVLAFCLAGASVSIIYSVMG
jgi:hypothetical protein